MAEAALLEVRGVVSGYGDGGAVLDDVTVQVAAREAVAIIGRNGMGKSTLVKTILGELRLRAGEILFQGQKIDGWAQHRIAALGLGLVPEGRRLFRSLSVEENLLATARRAEGGWTLPLVYETFPRLLDRRRQPVWQLSGGEQQMVAIARALMTNADLIVFDEASEGLSPLIREDLWRVMAGIRARGQALIVIDKHVRAVAGLVDRFYIFERGQVAWTGTTAEFLARPELTGRYLAVDAKT